MTNVSLERLALINQHAELVFKSLVIVTDKFEDYKDDKLRLEIQMQTEQLQNQFNVTACFSTQMLNKGTVTEVGVKDLEEALNDSRFEWHNLLQYVMIMLDGRLTDNERHMIMYPLSEIQAGGLQRKSAASASLEAGIARPGGDPCRICGKLCHTGATCPDRRGLDRCRFCGQDPPDHLGRYCPKRRKTASGVART